MAAPAAEEAVVEVSMTLNLDYQKLSADDKDELKGKIEEVLAESANVTTDAVSVTLTPGSVKVDAKIQTPDANAAKSMEKAMDMDVVGKSVMEAALTIPGVKAAAGDVLKVTGIQDVVKTASTCACDFEAMCTCESALAHLDCISKTCSSEECDCPAVQFSQSCGEIASVCKPMLDISCTPEQALCDGKFYQLSSSLAGLSIDLEKIDEDTHCGSTGKCTGKIDVQAAIHNAEEGMIMECFLEETPGSKEKTHCAEKVSGDSASCELPMPSHLPAGEKLEGWCRLVDHVDKDTSTRLTHDAPFYIYNHNKADEPKKKFAEAPAKLRATDSGAFGTQGIVAVLMAVAAAISI